VRIYSCSESLLLVTWLHGTASFSPTNSEGLKRVPYNPKYLVLAPYIYKLTIDSGDYFGVHDYSHYTTEACTDLDFTRHV
jgi:hypothetical protein